MSFCENNFYKLPFCSIRKICKRKSVPAILAAIKRYIKGHINESVERQNFCHRTQQPGETFDDFLVSLCEFGNS